ncbi:NUDIX domain-containing protein [Boudabousia tangfeifanii]|uniref:NUDIX domain-containing protein n=1 Tax=Boudabousia tangfeifanii TaxID=1912795 RepID=UPI001F33CFAE|nr:NUDIX domain-containing protein [Boudabousia tangfeifanii]
MRLWVKDQNNRWLFLSGADSLDRGRPSWLYTLGGRLEPGEDHLAALSRELREEVGWCVPLGHQVMPIWWRLAYRDFRINPYYVAEKHFYVDYEKLVNDPNFHLTTPSELVEINWLSEMDLREFAGRGREVFPTSWQQILQHIAKITTR